MQTKTVIFLGPQGSGKGTQAKRLTEHLKSNSEVFHFETGNALRELAAENAGMTPVVKKEMNAGNLLPAFLVTSLWTNSFITNLTPEHDLVLDGSPRSLPEAKLLDEALEFLDRLPAIVIHLTLPEEVTYERLAGRDRADDNRQAIERRLQQYKDYTLPVAKFLSEDGGYAYHRVDGEQTIEEINQEIIDIVTR